MNRRQCLQQALALPSLSAQTSSQRANVLFVAVDDLRPELGCYGVSGIKSPNIDRLARRGMVFDRAYCQQAVCSPSRTSLLTGARPDTTKVWDLVTHFRDAMPDVVTLPQHFRQNGYFVQGMGKIYHPGYDDPRSWSVPWQTPDAPAYALPESSGRFLADSRKKRNKGAKGPVTEAADVADEFYKDGKVANLAVSTLRNLATKNSPFFLAVGFAKPHLPFVAPKKYWDLYDPAKIAIAPNYHRPTGAPEYSLAASGEVRTYRGVEEGVFPEAFRRHLKHGYYSCVSYMDAQLGKVLDELDRSNLARNTIVVLWGDHGWKLGEHGEWAKHSNVENDTNLTLIVSAPSVGKAGQHTRALVEFVDIYPTLAELAGLPLPQHLEGTSFRPLLSDPKRAWKPAAFSQYPRGQRMGYSMRTERYRFTVWVDRKDHSKVEALELYDHRTDPGENTNAASAPGNADLVKRLMEQWRRGWRGAIPERV